MSYSVSFCIKNCQVSNSMRIFFIAFDRLTFCYQCRVTKHCYKYFRGFRLEYSQIPCSINNLDAVSFVWPTTSWVNFVSFVWPTASWVNFPCFVWPTSCWVNFVCFVWPTASWVNFACFEWPPTSWASFINLVWPTTSWVSFVSFVWPTTSWVSYICLVVVGSALPHHLTVM